MTRQTTGELVERLQAGVRTIPTNQYENDLYDIDDAETVMAEAATCITELQAAVAALAVEVKP